MAQLKDLIVTGPARVVGTLYAQSASTTDAGLVKLGGGTTNFLRADGTWAAPPNTTYTAATAAPGDISSSAGAAGSSTNYARQDHTHKISVTNSAPTLAWNTTSTVGTVAGVNLQVKLPANPNTNTTYSAGTGLNLSGTTFNHSNSVTAGTAGTSSATNGSTLAVPYVTYDAQGHVTGSGTHTHTVSGFLTSSSSLDASKLTGTVPSSVLPSYVDDVIEGYLYNSKFYKETAHTTEITAEASKIYVDLSNNKTYRWSGSAYVEISASLALGSTADTAAKGNHTHSASYTPAGSVSTPTISVKTAGSTTTVNSITDVGTTPSLTYTAVSIPNVTSVGSVPTTEDITCDDITAWSAGTVPTLGTAIAADDITAWSAGTAPSLTISNQTVVTGTSVSNEVLSFSTTTNGSASGWSAGTTPSLSYTARSIPNVTGVGTTPSLSYTARTVKSVKTVGSVPTLGTALSASSISAWSAGTLPTKGNNTTVKTGDAAYQSTQPTFSGTAATITTGTPA